MKKRAPLCVAFPNKKKHILADWSLNMIRKFSWNLLSILIEFLLFKSLISFLAH